MNALLALGVFGLLMLSSKKAAASDKPPALPAAPLRPVGPVVDVPMDPKNYGKPSQSAALAAAAAAAAASRKLTPPLVSPAAEPPIPVVAPAAADLETLPQDQITPAAQSPSKPSKALPEGYDPDSARRGAKAIASHLKRSGRANYDRRLLRSWQTKAAVKADGIYGGETRGALLFYGVPSSDAPSPFFVPTTTVPYVPPEKR